MWEYHGPGHHMVPLTPSCGPQLWNTQSLLLCSSHSSPGRMPTQNTFEARDEVDAKVGHCRLRGQLQEGTENDLLI